MPDLALTLLIQARDTATSVIQSLGSVLTTAASAVVGFGVQSIQAAGDYQQSMLKVQSLAGYTSAQIDQANQAILAMSGQVAQSPKQLADGLYYVASAGFTGANALNILKLSAEAAATGGTDTLTVANGLTSALNAFGYSGDKANMVMDMITKTVSAGKMQMSDYANVVGKLSTVSKAAGISFDQANAALATMTNSGYSAQYASTLLANLFTSLDIKTDALAKHAKALGISFDEQRFKSMSLADQIRYLDQVTGGNTATMYKLLGSNATALKTYEALKNSLSGYNDTLTKVRDSQGATATAFDVASQGFNFQMQRLSASFDVLKVTIGSAFLPILNQLLAGILPVVQSVTQWVTQSHVVQNVISYVGAAIQGILPDLKQLGSEIWAAVQGIISWVVQNNVLSQILHVAMGAAQLFFAVLKAAMPVLGDVFLRVLALVSQFLDWANKSNVLNIAITLIKNLLNVFLFVVQTVLPPILAVITGFMNWVTQSGLLQGGLNLVSAGVQGVSSWIQQALPGLQQYTDQTNKAATAANNLGRAGGQPGGPGGGGGHVPSGGTAGLEKPPPLTIWQETANFISSIVTPVWQQLASVWNNQVIPAWQHMLQAIQPIMPQLQALGMAIKIVGTAIGTGITVAVDIALRMLGLIPVVIGTFFLDLIGKVGAGFVQVWASLWAMILDVVTGQWGKIQTDFGLFQAGMTQIAVGLWQSISGAFQAGLDYASGLTDTITHDMANIWQWFYNLLVGHSIIPDLVNSIVMWFTNLGPMALAQIGNFINAALTQFGNFATNVYTFGQNIVINLINGLNSMLGSLASTVSNIASTIVSYLPHSPAERGPLSTVDRFMPSFISMLSGQLQAGAPQIAASMNALVMPMAVHAPAGASTSPVSGGNGGGGNTTINLTINAPGRSRNEAQDIANQVLDILSRQLLHSGLIITSSKGA